MGTLGLGNRRERRHIYRETIRGMKSGNWGQWEHRFGEHNPPNSGLLPTLTDGYCNNLYAVQRHKIPGCWDRIMVRSHDSMPVGWAALQRIKNELFGHETIAIQVLPRESDVVDSANMYWFFIVPLESEALIDRATNNKGNATA